MRETKTHCIVCGVAILQRTADQHDGRCVPCYREAAKTPPADFDLPSDLVDRLVALGMDPANYRQIAWRDGTDYVRHLADRHEKQEQHYSEWSPRLQVFARTCRIEQPIPNDDRLSAIERGKQRVFETRLTRPSLGSDSSVAICCMPLIAMSVARRLWPAEDDRIVLLTPEEESRWDKIYSPPEDILDWLPRFQWRIEDSPKGALLFEIDDGYTLYQWAVDKLSKGESAWFLYEVGPWGGCIELWAWNSSQVRYICNVFDFST